MSIHIPNSHESTLPAAVAPAAEQVADIADLSRDAVLSVGRGVISFVRVGLERIAEATYPTVEDARMMYVQDNTTDPYPSHATLRSELYGMRREWWSSVRGGMKTIGGTLVDRAFTHVPPLPGYDDMERTREDNGKMTKEK